MVVENRLDAMDKPKTKCDDNNDWSKKNSATTSCTAVRAKGSVIIQMSDYDIQLTYHYTNSNLLTMRHARVYFKITV